MLYDVASIFAVRTFAVSQAFTMVLAGSVIKPHCCLASQKQLVLRACVLSSFSTRDHRFDPGFLKSVG